ncbi:GvpL/GvpF family gas vesicle protein [Cognatiyoonia sp. IB215182]|uniref:GvpL/GvpF family gas vesicle protein n=1 Tax=Cognatiyoonia sp. IB215182 TaxID=3097353 RepID=UPI002A0B7B15|nr:GvpL/GvpF family gas vesicle protein [Cognatiyoonia sp. IB215182]MDX8351423.1 GvpL/GvpF family gas vesicle protein [Cognatiyoonia sp. IB215182]
MIYLYGLVEASNAALPICLDGVNGLQGPLQQTQIGPWTLIYSDHDDEEIMPRRRLLLAHTKVLETMLTTGTVLPARFGLVARDMSQIEGLVHSVQNEIDAEFKKLSGAIELGVRVSFERQAALAATLDAHPRLRQEREALQRKGPQAHFEIAAFGGKLADEMDRRRGAAQKALLTAIRPMARDHVLRKPEDDIEVLRAEFLVDAELQHSFEQSLADAASALDFAPGEEPRISVIGPVPMYNFVNLNLTFDVDQEAA